MLVSVSRNEAHVRRTYVRTDMKPCPATAERDPQRPGAVADASAPDLCVESELKCGPGPQPGSGILYYRGLNNYQYYFGGLLTIIIVYYILRLLHLLVRSYVSDVRRRTF